jgi:ABC-2 type transport system permease protein
VWNLLSHINPVFYAVQAVRIAFLGHADTPAGLTLAVLWAFALALSAWSLAVFRSGHTLKG